MAKFPAIVVAGRASCRHNREPWVSFLANGFVLPWEVRPTDFQHAGRPGVGIWPASAAIVAGRRTAPDLIDRIKQSDVWVEPVR
jgi:hypothetical protein